MSWENLLQMTRNCILCVDADNVTMMMMMMMQWRNLLSFTRNKLRILLHVLTLNTTYTFLFLSPCSSRNTNTHVGLLIQGIKNERALSALARAKRAHLWRRWRGKKVCNMSSTMKDMRRAQRKQESEIIFHSKTCHTSS